MHIKEMRITLHNSVIPLMIIIKNFFKNLLQQIREAAMKPNKFFNDLRFLYLILRLF